MSKYKKVITPVCDVKQSFSSFSEKLTSLRLCFAENKRLFKKMEIG